MTAQMPDKIENKFNDLDFGDLYLYRVIAGDITSNHGWGEPYQFTSSATPSKEHISSALWHGYISCYVLNALGELVLERFEYPFEENRAAETVNEPLKGNFWLVMKKGFYGDRTYIPFVRGKIVSDRSKWKIEDTGGNPYLYSSGDNLEKLFFTINKCNLLITVDFETAGSIKDFKVYIDGNVNFTYTTKDSSPENGHLIRISPGKHRIIMREFEHTKADRKESNTIHFEAIEGQTYNFHLINQNGQLLLVENA